MHAACTVPDMNRHLGHSTQCSSFPLVFVSPRQSIYCRRFFERLNPGQVASGLRHCGREDHRFINHQSPLPSVWPCCTLQVNLNEPKINDIFCLLFLDAYRIISFLHVCSEPTRTRLRGSVIGPEGMAGIVDKG
jgi:hypothetical protein